MSICVAESIRRQRRECIELSWGVGVVGDVRTRGVRCAASHCHAPETDTESEELGFEEGAGVGAQVAEFVDFDAVFEAVDALGGVWV